MGSTRRAQDARASAPARRTEPDWLAELRRRAGESFGSIPMPVEKDRGWEFTPLEGLDLEGRSQPLDGDLSVKPGRAAVVAEESGPGVLQVDGAAEHHGSGEPDGVIVTTLEQAVAEHTELVEPHLGRLVLNRDKFSAQNTMSWRGGAFVHVPRDVRVQMPVVLSAIQATAGSAMFWRLLVVVDPGAELTLVEQYLSSDQDANGYFNPVAELVVGEGATVNLLCAQDLSEQTWILGSQRAQVARDASLHWVGLGLGSGRGKLRMETDITGRGGSARVTGAYAGHGTQHLDYETTQEHAAPDTTSDLAFRGILRDSATAVWSGMIRVDPDAQRTDAFQESRNLLLSDGTHADAIPGLEIEADDVRCTHAATVGRIDEKQLFYLMSRGLERTDALRLLVEGFFEMTAARLKESKFLHDVVATALGRELERALD